MKSKLEHEIVLINLKIYKAFPELSNFIDAIPDQIHGEKTTSFSTKNLKSHFHALAILIKEYSKTHEVKNELLDAYPNYPVSEDIFNQDIEVRNLNPEDLSKNKSQNEKRRQNKEKSYVEDLSGDDLDIPGSELDDDQEDIGSEDEENNYYSLGGDAHSNLDENNE